jgi:acyl carrier protein
MMDHDDVRQMIEGAWHEALGACESLPEESFFALSGDSMSALAFVTKVESELEIAFPMDMLFAESLLAEIVKECESRYTARTSGSLAGWHLVGRRAAVTRHGLRGRHVPFGITRL